MSAWSGWNAVTLLCFLCSVVMIRPIYVFTLSAQMFREDGENGEAFQEGSVVGVPRGGAHDVAAHTPTKLHSTFPLP